MEGLLWSETGLHQSHDDEALSKALNPLEAFFLVEKESIDDSDSIKCAECFLCAVHSDGRGSASLASATSLWGRCCYLLNFLVRNGGTERLALTQQAPYGTEGWMWWARVWHG